MADAQEHSSPPSALDALLGESDDECPFSLSDEEGADEDAKSQRVTQPLFVSIPELHPDHIR